MKLPDIWFGVGSAEGRLYGNRLELRVSGERKPDTTATDRDGMYRALAKADGYRGCGDGCEHPLCWLPRRFHA